MTVSRLAGALAALLAFLIVTAPAGAAAPAPQPLDASIRGLLAQERGAKARTRMGLPPYGVILGRRWNAKVARADAQLVAALAPGARAARAAAAGDDAIEAADTLRRGAERQKRRLRLAVALDSMCPVFDKTNAEFATTITATGRAEHIVATVERVRGYDITTIVTLDAHVQARASVDGGAVLAEPTADWGTFSVVRQQTARNLKTGKIRQTGPPQRMHGSLGPLFNIETGFDEFVERNADGDDESPAPRRPQRTDAWNRVAQDFVVMLYSAMRGEYKKAEAHFRTPNACVTLDVPAPTHLALGQSVNLTGVVRARQGSPTPKQILRDARIAGYLENEQGQTARTLASYPLDPGEVWYEFTAPKRKWPDSRPIGMEIVATSEGGIASQKVFFKAREVNLPPRFQATMSVKSTSDRGDYRELDGSAVYTLRSAIPGPDGSLNAWYDVEQSSITHALGTLFQTEGCRYQATGAGGGLESGDLELRVLPDGQMVYAFMLHHAIPTSYVATDCPPGTQLPPIPVDLPAHLDTRRPGPAAQSLRPLPADFQHQVEGATDVKSALMDANTATWVLTPQW
jgi:hypothetical protein